MPGTKPPLLLLAPIVALASLAAGLGGCDGSPDEGAPPPVPPVSCSSASATPTTSVLISGMEFLPYCAIVGAGSSVTFTNADAVIHTVTADSSQPEPFDSGLLFPGQQFPYAFAGPETIRVHDRLNPWVAGIVIVQ